MPGPLHHLTVIELAGLGPAPFCGMVLADLGAEVIRVDRADQVVGGHTSSTRHDLTNRGKSSLGLDLKQEAAQEILLDLVAGSDVLIEGFRPGVAERLGVGPAQCLARNPRLVYGRMTGWGQEGPRAGEAGHDIDYIALSGALYPIGTAETPIPPLNLVGDYGGGAMLLAVGVLAAVIHARETGEGQVVDAAMIDGSALLTTPLHGSVAEGWWTEARASNLLDGGAPFYAVYSTADGGHLAVGALEPHFYANLLRGLGIDPSTLPDQNDREGWPVIRERFASVIAERTREEWEARFRGRDACVAPVLAPGEAPRHQHNRERGVFIEVGGVTQPAPAPRFAATPSATPSQPCYPGADTEAVLARLGLAPEEIVMLREAGAVA